MGGLAGLISDFFNSIGQFPLLPHRKIDGRFTSINGH
jgi:hypothetical protein